jgi:hypothetical protein
VYCHRGQLFFGKAGCFQLARHKMEHFEAAFSRAQVQRRELRL